MTNIDLSIIIINFRTPTLTLQCLESLSKSIDTLNKEIILVDNASGDGSVEQIRRAFPQVNLIQNPTNAGFAPANNLGVKQALGEYVLLLNSDTQVYPNTLQQFYDQTLKHQADLASCQLLNADGSLQPQGGNLPSLTKVSLWMLGIDDLPGIKQLVTAYQEKDQRYYQSDHQVGWLGGTALLVKKSVYDSLGGLDEQIFMYGEDVEFCLRARQRGHSIWYFCQPQITHLGQQSGSKANAILGEYRGLKYLYNKHKPTWQCIILRLMLKIGALLRVLVFAIMGNYDQKNIYQQAFSLA